MVLRASLAFFDLLSRTASLTSAVFHSVFDRLYCTASLTSAVSHSVFDLDDSSGLDEFARLDDKRLDDDERLDESVAALFSTSRSSRIVSLMTNVSMIPNVSMNFKRLRKLLRP